MPLMCSMFSMSDFSLLEKITHTTFKNQDLLKQALVHRSYLNENPGFALGHNERMEFLGDAVLELAVTEYLYEQFPDKPEGELTNLRASLVNAVMLAKISNEIDLENFLFLSKGESKDKASKARMYILANAMESLIGAIYLDRGMLAATKFIERFIISKLDEVFAKGLYFDAKSKFQEIAQEKTSITPSYKVLSAVGPDHAKVFTVGLYLDKDLVSQGAGSSKQEAQMAAAAEGLKVKGWA